MQKLNKYAKTGTYNILFDNFHNYGTGNNGTGTVYVDQVNVIPEPNQYTIDWNKVVTNTNDAVQYSVDTDTNGTYETTTNLSPVFQDIVPPTTTSTLTGTLQSGTTNSYLETVDIALNATDNTNGSGVYKTYFTLDNYYPQYTEYTQPITVNGYGNYTLKYYSVDKFGNKEIEKIKNFTIVQTPPTNTGKISGYVYEDTNNNGIKDTGENTMAGWKVYLDTNNDGQCQENTEPFNVSNNQGYFEFDSLTSGTYKLREVPHQNWTILSPTVGYYSITLTNGQQVTNKNFGNKNTKKK